MLRKLPLSIIAVVLLSGCASSPTGQIEVFAQAATDSLSKVESVVDEFNQARINDRIVMMAQSDDKYVTADFAKLNDLHLQSNKKDKLALQRATQSLASYAEALADLSTVGSREELSIAGAKLSQSLATMNSQYQVLAGEPEPLMSIESSSKLGRLVAELGSYYTEKKRAESLKRVILTADPAVQLLGEAISVQLLSGVIESRLYVMRGNELAGHFADYNARVGKMNFAQKKKALDQLYEKYRERESAAASVAMASKAVKSIMKAHAVMAKELEQGEFESADILNAVGLIKRNHQAFDDLESLITSCKTEIIADPEKGIICKAG